jgi:hypothetical protein
MWRRCGEFAARLFSALVLGFLVLGFRVRESLVRG